MTQPYTGGCACPACGTPVYLSFVALPDMIAVHAGSLDDPGRFVPQVLTYSGRGLAWDTIRLRCRHSRGCRQARGPSRLSSRYESSS